MITAERLREFTHYDPDSGIFTWRVGGCGKRKIGAVIGSRTNHGYLDARIDGVRVYLHRMAWLYMTGNIPDYQIDHINGNRTDNRFCNLREASNGQNQQNAKLKKTNTSGYKGVYWNTSNNAWVACICIDGKSKYIGSFRDPKDAHEAWLKAAEYRGEYLRTA